MPFIAQKQDNPSSTRFYLIRGIGPNVGITIVAQRKALYLAQQGKRVLLFDGLLGLKNISVSTSTTKKINSYFKGDIPLTNLITHHKGIDIIAGTAQQNLNALDTFNQNKVKQDLLLLAQNYDDVLIDLPSHIVHTPFQGIGTEFWVISADKKIILDTLNSAHSSPFHLIINDKLSAAQLNELTLFVKTLVSECQLEISCV